MPNKRGNNAECQNCSKSFSVNPAYIRRGGGKFCSRTCFNEAIRENPSSYICSGGYIVVRRQRVHRTLMEQHLGRKLATDEHVHHINGNKQDNRLENLVVLSASEHHKMHPTQGHGLTKDCAVCGKSFKTKPSDINNRKYCSHTCYFEDKRSRKKPVEVKERIGKGYKRVIRQFTMDGALVREWESIKGAATELGYSRTAISECVAGRYSQSHGFIWRY